MIRPSFSHFARPPRPDFTAVLMAALLSAAPLGYAQQPPTVVLRSTVTGNQEQPKVLYIVPWQQPDGPSAMAQPVQTLVDDLFTPLEREEFIRELQYRERWQTSAQDSPGADEEIKD